MEEIPPETVSIHPKPPMKTFFHINSLSGEFSRLEKWEFFKALSLGNERKKSVWLGRGDEGFTNRLG